MIGVFSGVVGGLWNVINKSFLISKDNSSITEVNAYVKITIASLLGLAGALVTTTVITFCSNVWVIKRRIINKEDFSDFIGDLVEA